MVRALQVDRELPPEIEPPPMPALAVKPPRPEPWSRAGGAVCPHCLTQSHTEKVSHVVFNGRGRLYWENGEVAHYETELCRLLDAPPQPREVPLLQAAIGLLTPFLLLGLTLLVLSLLGAQDYAGIPQEYLDSARTVAIVWFGVIVPGVLLAAYVKSRFDLRKKLPVWRAANRRWTGLYYCSHDDIVFEPNLDAVALPKEMDTLLYVADAPAPRPQHAQPLLRGLSALGILLLFLGAGLTGLSTTNEAGNAPSPPAAEVQTSEVGGIMTQQALQPADVASNRANCDEIRGTDYHSPEERVWYLANCV